MTILFSQSPLPSQTLFYPQPRLTAQTTFGYSQLMGAPMEASLGNHNYHKIAYYKDTEQSSIKIIRTHKNRSFRLGHCCQTVWVSLDPNNNSAVDLGEGARGSQVPFILVKKEKTQKVEKPAGQVIFANQHCFNIAVEHFSASVAKK